MSYALLTTSSIDDSKEQQGGNGQPAASSMDAMDAAGAGPKHARAAFHAETTG